MTQTQTASEQITEEVTAWPGVQAATGSRGEFAFTIGRREIGHLHGDRVPTKRDWSRLSKGWSARIDARIAELERLRLGLTGCIGCGCLSLERCKLANPDDRAARLGPGPRYWVGDRPLGG